MWVSNHNISLAAVLGQKVLHATPRYLDGLMVVPNAPFVKSRYRKEGHASMSRESRYIEARALGLPSGQAASSQAGSSPSSGRGQQGGGKQGRSQEGGWQPSQKGCWKKGRWSNNG